MGHKYDPDYAVHPGETVREYLLTSTEFDNVYDIVSWTVHPAWAGPRCECREYETRGLPEGYTEAQMLVELTGVVFCGEQLLPPHAEVLHKVLGIPGKFWLERQRIYDERLAGPAIARRKYYEARRKEIHGDD